MRYLFYCDTVGRFGSVGVLVLRLVVGAAFILHGWPKIQNPTAWMGPEGMPGILQALAAVAEFGGGIALIPGFLTRLASLGIASVMVAAIGVVHLPKGHAFVSMDGPTWELAAVYLACAVLFLILGPGKISLDALVFGRASSPRTQEP